MKQVTEPLVMSIDLLESEILLSIDVTFPAPCCILVFSRFDSDGAGDV